MRTDIRVTVHGPFFEKGAAPVVEAVKRAVEATVEEGARTAERLARAHSRTGRYADSVRGRVSRTGTSGRVKSYGGPRRMPYSAVHERGRRYASGSRFRGHFVLKRARDQLDPRAAQILEREIERAVQELN